LVCYFKLNDFIAEKELSMGQSMKVAILGLGDIAQKAYLPILTAHESVDLMFYNRSEDRLKTIQARYRVEDGTTSLAQVIDSQAQSCLCADFVSQSL
jgi:predicted dehydrogenase